MSIRNIEITIFDPADGVGIGGTESSQEIYNDLFEDSMFGKEFQEADPESQRKWVAEDLIAQVTDEINRLMKGANS